MIELINAELIWCKDKKAHLKRCKVFNLFCDFDIASICQIGRLIFASNETKKETKRKHKVGMQEGKRERQQVIHNSRNINPN